MIPKKWEPVSRLREAWVKLFLRVVASAGEGRSEKIMLKQKDGDESDSAKLDQTLAVAAGEAASPSVWPSHGLARITRP